MIAPGETCCFTAVRVRLRLRVCVVNTFIKYNYTAYLYSNYNYVTGPSLFYNVYSCFLNDNRYTGSPSYSFKHNINHGNSAVDVTSKCSNFPHSKINTHVGYVFWRQNTVSVHFAGKVQYVHRYCTLASNDIQTNCSNCALTAFCLKSAQLLLFTILF